MAFGDVTVVDEETGSGGTTHIQTYDAATAGHLIVAGMSMNDSQTSWVTPSGFTLLQESFAGAAFDVGSWWKIAAGGETTITYEGSTTLSQFNSAVVTVEGPFDAAPFDASAIDESNMSSATQSQTCGPATCSAVNALAVAMVMIDSESNWDADDGGSWTEDFATAIFSDVGTFRPGCVIATKVLTATGSISTVNTTTDTGDEAAGILGIWLSDGAGGGPGGGTILPQIMQLH